MTWTRPDKQCPITFHSTIAFLGHSTCSTTSNMQRILIAIGAVFLLLGLLWPWLYRLGVGRLPGTFASKPRTASSTFRSCPAWSSLSSCRLSFGLSAASPPYRSARAACPERSCRQLNEFCIREPDDIEKTFEQI